MLVKYCIEYGYIMVMTMISNFFFISSKMEKFNIDV